MTGKDPGLPAPRDPGAVTASPAHSGVQPGPAPAAPGEPASEDPTPEDKEFTHFKEDADRADGAKPGAEWFEKASYLSGALPGHIGPFRIVKLIKEGGMGAVYLGVQTRPVERRVAIKIIKRTLDSPAARQRLEVECRLLARFNHPNIASFIDCGFCERIPFIVMEYIDGKGILEFCQPRSGGSEPRKPRLDLRRRLEIFLQACDGMWHAHQRGVIHGDISATNVMITELDGKALVKLIDFGLAVLQEQGRAEAGEAPPGPRKVSYRMGTVAYMSPERLRGPHDAVDARSDVYSLGVLLFELVTGERPYAVVTEEDALARYNALDKPIAPSTKVEDITRKLTSSKEVDRGRLRDLRRLLAALRGDLDVIVVKALEINPEHRYGSVRDLADDLRAYLEGRPLRFARQASRMDRFRKFLQRNGAACTAAALAVLFLVAAASISSVAALKQSGLNTELKKANVDLEDKKRGEETKRRERDDALRRLRTAQANSYAAQIRGLPDLLARGEFTSARQALLGTAFSEESKAVARTWEWNHLLARIEASDMVLGLSRRGFVDVLDAGNHICGISGDGSVWFWRADTGQFVRTNRLHKDTVVAAWASPESGLCQTLDASGVLIRWTVADGKKQDRVEVTTPLGGVGDAEVVFSPDGTRLCLYRPGAGELLLLPTGLKRQGVPVPPIPPIRLAANAQTVRLSWNKESLACLVRGGAGGSRGKGSLRLLEWTFEANGDKPQEPKQVVLTRDLELPQALVHAGGQFLLQYPAGAILFRCKGPPDVRLDGDSVAVLVCNGSWLGTAALSADGTRVVTGGTADDRAIRVWNARTGDFEGRLTGNSDDLGVRLGHDREVTRVAFTQRGILSASADGTIRKWDIRSPRYLRQLLPDAPDKQARQRSDMAWLRFLTKDSELLTVYSDDPWLVVWNTREGSPLFRLGKAQATELLPEGYKLVLAGASNDGTRIAFVRHDAKLNHYDLVVGTFTDKTTLSLKPIPVSPPGRVQDLAVSNNGRMVALSVVNEENEEQGQIQLWRWLGDEEPGGAGETLPDGAGCLQGLAFSENAAQLAGCGKGLRVWELQGQRTSRYFPFSAGDLRSPAFSPDGTKIALGVARPVADLVEPAGLLLVDLETGKLTPFGQQEASVVHGIAWDPSGVRMATAEHDVVRIWSAPDNCRLLLTLRDTPSFVNAIAWSGDGEWVAAACPASGTFLFDGPVQEDREGLFYLRELQRAHPIRAHLEAHWQSVPGYRRFDKQYEQFRQMNGDDPGTIAEWAWKQLLPTDDTDAVKYAQGARGDKGRLDHWKSCCDTVQWAAGQWEEDPELQLLAGIARYRHEQWEVAMKALENFVAARRTSLGRQFPLGDDDLVVIGKLYLAMACQKKGQGEDAVRHVESALQWLGERGHQKKDIVSFQGTTGVHRAGLVVELVRKEAQAVFPQKAATR